MAPDAMTDQEQEVQRVAERNEASRVYYANDLARRWGISRQRVFQIEDTDDRMPRGERVESTRGERAAIVVWPAAAIHEYEAISGRKVAD